MSTLPRKVRIGLIIPPADGREPPECAILYPQIDFVTVGLGIKEMSPQGFAEVMDRLFERARTLVSRGAEVLSIMGTSFSFYRGNSFNEETCTAVAQAAGIPTTSMATAVVRALKANRVSRVALATAYTSDLNERLSAFLLENGIRTAGTVGLGLRDIDAVRPTSPEAVGQAAQAAVEQDCSADGILISCGGLPTLQLHGSLERRFNVPVVSSLPAGLWDVVQLCGHDARAEGFGRMFEVSLTTVADTPSSPVSAREHEE
jgi:arylmalonate decarboxylase